MRGTAALSLPLDVGPVRDETLDAQVMRSIEDTVARLARRTGK